MSDPPRWLDADSDVSPGKALLKSAHAPAMPSEVRTRLGDFTRTLSTTPVQPPNRWSLKAKLLGGTGLSVVLAGLSVSTALWVRPATPSHQSLTHSPLPALPLRPTAKPPVVASLPASAVPPQPRQAHVDLEVPPSHAPRAVHIHSAASRATLSAAPGPTVSTPSVIVPSEAVAPQDSELTLLWRARRTVDSTPTAALQTLQELARLYPSGHYNLEREVLTIRALLRAGLTSSAQQRGRAFLQNHPHGLYTDTVRHLLGAPQ